MRIATLGVFGLLLVLTLGACSDSPTEPSGAASASFISLTADTLPMLSETGALTLSSAVCGCASSPLTVAINGTVAGSTPCSAQQVFPMPLMAVGTARYEIRVTDSAGATGIMSFAVTANTPGAPSLTVRAICP